MRILLVNVCLRPDSPKKLFPIGLGYIATAIKNGGFDFDLLDIDAYRYTDQQVEALLGENHYDVVCMGCIVTGYKYVKLLAEQVKRVHPQAIVVAGNSVATSIPEHLLQKTQVDIAVMGEGDITVVELLAALANSRPWDEVDGICFKQNGEVIHTKPRPAIPSISVLPHIDFSLFDAEIYINNAKLSVSDPLPIPRESVRALPINTARGCVANCTFCYHVFRGMPYRYRSPESIVGEIKDMIAKYDLNYIQFWDELTFFSKKQINEFVDKVIAENVKFYWEGTCRADLFNGEDDLELMAKMKKAGCLAMSYSLESADSNILKAMNKHITTEQFSRQTALLHQAGLAVYTSLVFGYPQETVETINSTFDCCIKNRIYPSSGFLLPQPGSPMYDYARNKGFIVDEEDFLMAMGDRQDLRINLTGMADDVLSDAVMTGLKKCNEVLEVGLKEEELVRTTYYRSDKPQS